MMETQLLTVGRVIAADELEKRRRQRQKKVREEKRRERRIEMEENKKQGKCKWSRNLVQSLRPLALPTRRLFSHSS